MFLQVSKNKKWGVRGASDFGRRKNTYPNRISIGHVVNITSELAPINPGASSIFAFPRQVQAQLDKNSPCTKNTPGDNRESDAIPQVADFRKD